MGVIGTLESNRRTAVPRATPSILQFHVTERCNLRCTHCYQAATLPSEMTFDQLLHLAEAFMAVCKGRGWIGQIYLTGGEPFVRADFMELLEALTRRHEPIQFAVLTNGTMIDSKLASRLASLRPLFVQISIDGGQTVHDTIRGKGSYVRAAEALRRLAELGVSTSISFTAHRGNYRDFPAVVELAEKTRTRLLWSDRLVPLGCGSTVETLLPNETREFFVIMERSRRALEAKGSPTRVHLGRALQFLIAGGSPYRCSAGRSLLAVMPDGTVYPCRRLPIDLGNVLEKPLHEFYEFGDVHAEVPERCASCQHGARCHGGLRCLSYAVDGNLRGPDPGCWLASPEEMYVSPSGSGIRKGSCYP